MGTASRSKEQRARDNGKVEEILKRSLPLYDRSIHTKVVGVKFKNDDGTLRQRLIENLAQFENVQLVRNPADQFDGNAINVIAEIEGSAAQIGYINADLAEELAPALDEGETWKAIVTRVDGHITKGVALMLYRPVQQ